MKIPRITPTMLRSQPDQTAEIINRLIDKVNGLDKTLESMQSDITYLLNKPEPTIDGGFYQVLPFDPTHMGNTPGMCLQNCREGFGIATGTYATAREDMEAQINEGILHDGTPPMMLQVPVYVESGTPNGHVVVWDRGVVWSDGAIEPEGLAHWPVIHGWGEKCDGTRVIDHLSA